MRNALAGTMLTATIACSSFAHAADVAAGKAKAEVCVACHGMVTEERMEALPWATQCADCARPNYSWLR